MFVYITNKLKLLCSFMVHEMEDITYCYCNRHYRGSGSVEPAVRRSQLVEKYVHIRLLAVLRALVSDLDQRTQRKN